MRTYRAAMPPVRFSSMNQPPLDGPEWPRVVGKPLAAVPSYAMLGLSSTFLFPSLGLVSFWLGTHWKPFYLASILFAVLTAQQSYEAWKR